MRTLYRSRKKELRKKSPIHTLKNRWELYRSFATPVSDAPTVKADGVAEDGTLCRTRLEACQIENREFELAEGFKDLSDDHSNNTASWDWVSRITIYVVTADTRQVTLSRSPVTSISPEGWTFLALHPLPSLRPPSLAMALLHTPNGLILSHVDLMDGTTETSSTGTWSALRGSPIQIRDGVGLSDISLCLSQGVSRGELGLIAIISKEFGAILILGPRLERELFCICPAMVADDQALKDDIDIDGSSDGHASDAARSIVLAMAQKQNWTDAVRASLASVAQNERTCE
jgi:hypothetical protein